MRADKLERFAALAAGAAVFAWFLRLVSIGLDSWFDGDDLMNLHYYWSRPWSALLKANLAFWSSYYRPAGGLFYRPIYAIWGFHPLPFHVALLAFLIVNFMLLAFVVWRLTGSRWGTLIALFVIGINPCFYYAYFDTGAIYDVLAYTFFWGAFALYLHLRREGRMPGWGGQAIVFGLVVLALDAKEIAVSLPVAIGLYELVWHPPANWRWIWREGRCAVIGGAAVAAYVIGKKYGPDSLWLVSSYQPHYSLGAYFESLSHYLRMLIYHPVTILPWQMAALLAAMLGVALLTRRRHLLWAVGFIAVGVLPLAFIPSRDGFAYLVPSAGWAVYVAGFLAWLLELCTGKRVWLRRTVQVVLCLALVWKLAPWQHRRLGMSAGGMQAQRAPYRQYIEQIHALIPAPRKGARILLLNDAAGRDDWDVYFVIRLDYGDPALEVTRATVWNRQHIAFDPRGYDYVLDFVDGKFVLADHK